MTGRRAAYTLLIAFAGLSLGVQPSAAQQCTDWSWSESLRIGSLDGPDALSHFHSVATDPAGRVYIPQISASRVLVFDDQGNLVDRIGRAGSGPGEFDFGPRRVTWYDGALWVSDRSRLQSYSPDGEALTFVSFRNFDPLEGVYFRPGGPLSDGSYVPTQSFTPVPEGAPQELIVRRYDDSGTALATMARIPTGPDRVIIDDQGGFAQHPLWSLLPSTASNRIAALVTADRDGLVLVGDVRPDAASPTFDLLRVSLDGDTVMQRAIPYEPRRLTRRDHTWWADNFSAMIAGDFTPSTSRSRPRSDTQRNRERRQAREALEMPSTYPPVRQILAGTDDSIWLLREPDIDGGPNVWEVYDADGVLRGRLIDEYGRDPYQPWHPALKPMLVSESVAWAAVLDEFQVFYLVRLTIDTGCRP